MQYQTDKSKLPEQIKQVISIAENLFSNQILGIYLYGSSALGCLRPNSDLDILIITNQEMPIAVRENLTKELSAISGSVGCIEKRPLEVTVINQNDIVPWKFPPKCEYMYGEWLRDEIDAGKIPQSCYDPDIAILLWQAQKYSITLTGTEAEKLILPIPFYEIQKAIKYSLPNLIDSLDGDERNVLLTLSRTWYTLETGEISTKDIAAEWILPQLPVKFAQLIEIAKEAYLGNVCDDWKDNKAETMILADFMRQQIEKLFQLPEPC